MCDLTTCTCVSMTFIEQAPQVRGGASARYVSRCKCPPLYATSRRMYTLYDTATMADDRPRRSAGAGRAPRERSRAGEIINLDVYLRRYRVPMLVVMVVVVVEVVAVLVVAVLVVIVLVVVVVVLVVVVVRDPTVRTYLKFENRTVTNHRSDLHWPLGPAAQTPTIAHS